MAWKTVQSRSYVGVEEKVHNGWEGVDKLTSPPDFATHWDVDKIILEAASDGDNASFNTVIVCPPAIYCVGRGPGNKRGQQLYDLTRMMLTSGGSMRVGRGENRQTHVHVHNLSDSYVLLVEQTAAGGQGD